MAISKYGEAGYNSAAGVTVSFSSGSATAGRLLICGLNHSTGSAAGVTTPSGWSVWAESGVVGLRTFLYYKYATGGETSVSWSWSSGGFGTAFLIEFDNAVSGAPIVAVDDSVALTPGSTSCTSGTANATFASGLAVAYFSGDSGSNVDGSRSYTNGFSEDYSSFSTSRASTAILTKAITGTGNYSTTFSCVDTGDEIWGSIALFQSAGPSTITGTGTSTVGFTTAAAGTVATVGAGYSTISFPISASGTHVTPITAAGYSTISFVTVGSGILPTNGSATSIVGFSTVGEGTVVTAANVVSPINFLTQASGVVGVAGNIPAAVEFTTVGTGTFTTVGSATSSIEFTTVANVGHGVAGTGHSSCVFLTAASGVHGVGGSSAQSIAFATVGDAFHLRILPETPASRKATAPSGSRSARAG